MDNASAHCRQYAGYNAPAAVAVTNIPARRADPTSGHPIASLNNPRPDENYSSSSPPKRLHGRPRRPHMTDQ